MARNRAVLVPQYVRKFSCIGPECEDTCCAGWRVSIDRATFKKYTRLKDPRLKPDMEASLKRNKKNPSDREFGYLKMKPGGICPFLTEERFCRIQLLMGPDMLSDVCETFPRATNEVNGVLEKSLTLACPEAARLALLNPDGIEFDEMDEPADTRKMTHVTLDTADARWDNRPERWFWELRFFTIQLLQNRSYTLAERLIVLGMFIQSASQYAESDRTADIPQLIASYMAMVEDGSLRDSLAKVPASLLIQLKFVKQMADMRFAHSRVGGTRFLECIADCLYGLGYTLDASDQELSDRYSHTNDQFYRPFAEEYHYILENYLVNYVYYNLFPFNRRGGSMYDEYIMLVVHYAMVKMVLIGMGARFQGVTPEMAIKVIQSLTKIVDHNPLFLNSLLTALREGGHTGMPFMAILVKN